MLSGLPVLQRTLLIFYVYMSHCSGLTYHREYGSDPDVV